MDVLLHAAIKERDRLKQQYEDLNIQTFSAESLGQTPSLLGVYSDLNTAAAVDVYDENAAATLEQQWCSVLGETTAVRSNGLKVCSTVADMGGWRCGANCTWVVPANVERVLFQSWGPGGGSASSCCCGGSPFGANGAYTAVEISVTPGDTYTLCAGCAYCCYAYQTTPGAVGGDTTITGPNLDIATKGGVSCCTAWSAAVGPDYALNPGQLPTAGPSACSPTWCSGWNFCYDSTNDQFCIPFAYGEATWDVNELGGTDPVFYGIPSMYPQTKLQGSFGDNNPGYTEAAPVYGFAGCGCQFPWGGSSCFGCNMKACQGHGQYPGRGASPSKTFGGCNACGGDSGRFGMVCVSWETV
jgi:hypothetical protein